MNYPLENLGDERFQQLCQALLSKANPGVQCFPVGQPDGGRDATRRGTSSTGKENFLVYQVKFVRDPSTKKNPREWLLKIIEDEIEKVRALVDKSATGYFLITNVRGSSHLDIGSIDQMQDLLSEKLDLPASCWWRDDIERRLDNAWDIKWAFPDVMTGSDFLRAVFEIGLEKDLARRESTLRAFLRDQYDRDSQVKFRQVDLQSKLLDLFVDVPIVAGSRITNTAERNSYLRTISQVRIEQIGYNQQENMEAGKNTEIPYDEQKEIGAASFLLSRFSNTNYSWLVLEGGPGQGKSTISQYIAQVHRIRLLEIWADKNKLCLSHRKSPKRLPIRIDLRDFAQWVRKKNSSLSSETQLTGLSSSQLEPFIASLISHFSGGAGFSVDDLIAVTKISAVSLILDGLDEVADLTTRQLVVDEIAAGCQRLSENTASLQVLVTSRPAIFSDSPRLPDERFKYFRLTSLTPRLINVYVELWGRARNVPPEIQLEFRDFIQTKLEQPHIKELAKNPMQLSILLSLINARGVALPEKRTALYDAYIDHFLARESEKNSTIRENRDLILDLHKYIAWIMHSEAEEKGNRGSIEQQRLIHLLRQYLELQGNDPAIAAHLFKDMVDRVFALVSRDQGSFEFEVQPLREYFAAKFLFDTAPLSTTGNEQPGSVPDRFEAIAPRSFWMNVTRFFAGCYSKGEIPSLIGSIQSLYDDKNLGLTNLPAFLSVALLSDWVFSQLPKQILTVTRQLTENDRLLRFAAASDMIMYEEVESALSLSNETAAFQLALKCFENLGSDLPEAWKWTISFVVRKNLQHANKIVDEWFRCCLSLSEKEFSKWLHIGQMMGVLQKLNLEQLMQLTVSATTEHVRPLLEAQQQEFLESSPDLLKKAMDLTLRCEVILLERPEKRLSPMDIVSVGLLSQTYRYVIHRPMPLAMGEAVRRYDGHPVEQLASWTAKDDRPELHQIEEFARDVARQLERPVKDWTSSLSPWNEVAGTAARIWGEQRAIKFFAIVAAGARTGKKAKHGDINNAS